MKFFKKHSALLIILGVTAIYLFTRLCNILALPVFTDEAIYIRWGQIAATDPDWLFISLTDGKQPLFIWFMMPWFSLLPDPLIVGRMVSVMAGLFTMLGLYLLATELFGRKAIGLLASVLYLFFPFALVYDRIALYDSLVATLMVWALYAEIKLVKTLQWRYALLTGVVIGLGLLNKSIAEFGLILLPFALLLFPFRDKKLLRKLGKFVLLSIFAAIIAEGFAALLRLSPFHYIIAQKNTVFVRPFAEWIKDPFVAVFQNTPQMTHWLVEYFSWSCIVLVLVSLIILRKFWKEKILLLLWFIVPFSALAFFGVVLYPRYLLFMTMPLLILAAVTFFVLLQRLKYPVLQVMLFIVLLLPFFITDYHIITDFKNAPIPQSDKGQFLTSWPSGVGVRETVDFINEKAKKEKIFVATQGTFGLMPYALEMYFYNNPNVIIKGYYMEIDGAAPPKEVLDAKKKMPTYFVFYQKCGSCSGVGKAPPAWKLKQLFQFEKAEKGNWYTFYQVL